MHTTIPSDRLLVRNANTMKSKTIPRRRLHGRNKNMEDDDMFGPYDILCGRCKQAFNHVGNRRFRITISLYLDRYLETTTKKEKGNLIVSIVRYLRGCVGARFLKKIKGSSNRYVELGEREAREKVGHALRDLAVTTHQSTMAELVKARKQKCKKAQEEQEQPTKMMDVNPINLLEPQEPDVDPGYVVPESLPIELNCEDDDEDEFFHDTLSLLLTPVEDFLLRPTKCF